MDSDCVNHGEDIQIINTSLRYPDTDTDGIPHIVEAYFSNVSYIDSNTLWQHMIVDNGFSATSMYEGFTFAAFISSFPGIYSSTAGIVNPSLARNTHLRG
ncbi:MAG: hypothetical protein N3F63_00850 [Thermoplasmata archaeon]|nr:hypothetical protein [Thermoplasmata archaeon]